MFQRSEEGQGGLVEDRQCVLLVVKKDGVVGRIRISTRFPSESPRIRDAKEAGTQKRPPRAASQLARHAYSPLVRNVYRLYGNNPSTNYGAWHGEDYWRTLDGNKGATPKRSLARDPNLVTAAVLTWDSNLNQRLPLIPCSSPYKSCILVDIDLLEVMRFWRGENFNSLCAHSVPPRMHSTSR